MSTFVRPALKPGRNQACGCGSGRKFKHCCGSTQQGGAGADIDVQELIARAHQLHEAGRFDEAIEVLRRVLAADPRFHGIHLNIAVAHQAAGRSAKSIEHCRLAVAAMPDSVPARCTLATMQRLAGELEAAEDSLRAALSLEPDNVTVLEDLAAILSGLGRSEEVVALLAKAVKIAPGNVALRSALILARLYLPETSTEMLDRELAGFDAVAMRMRAGVEPAPRPVRREGRIRIAYVSADFREHSVAYFLEPVLGAHDRARFEVFCYNVSHKEDQVTARLRKGAEHWRHCAHLSDESIAREVIADDIDVLFDLSGHTAGNRLGVFALRPARRQLSWIGFPGDTGLRAIDSAIGDDCVLPPGSMRAIRLPGAFSCYQPPGDAPGVGPAPGLQSGYVTLGSFNHLAKVSDATVSLWSRVLREIPSAKLMLKHRALNGERIRAWVVERFARHGIETDRLVMARRDEDTSSHLAQYGKIDIALDPFPYCGMTTTCEALWMGVPVVSLVGTHFSSRTGLSVLSSIGRREWAKVTVDDYVECVKALAADPERLSSMRAPLREAVRNSPLTDGRACTRGLEEAILRLVALTPGPSPTAWERGDNYPLSPTGRGMG